MPLLVGGDILVRKLDYISGQPTMSWPGTLLELTRDRLVVQAPFLPRGPDAIAVDGVPLVPGDLFTEYYFLGRYYNVFHIADEAGCLKGWYCNVTQPPHLDEEGVSFVDLALDLFAHPDGRYRVLDEDEFAAASQGIYLPNDVADARTALENLVALARGGRLPAPAHDA